MLVLLINTFPTITVSQLSSLLIIISQSAFELPPKRTIFTISKRPGGVTPFSCDNVNIGSKGEQNRYAKTF